MMIAADRIFTGRIASICWAAARCWRGAWGVVAMAAMLALVGGAAEATETIIGKALASKGAAYTYRYVLDKSGTSAYVIYNGGSDNCGGIYKFTKIEGVWQLQWETEFKPPDCNPTDISLDATGTGEVVAVEVSFLVQSTGGKYAVSYVTPLTGALSSTKEEVPGVISGVFFFNPFGPASIVPGVNAPPGQGAALYITTGNGGAKGVGAIYESTISGTGAPSTPKLIFSFPGGALGANPVAGAVLGADGSLYGTTLQGGDTAAAACVNVDGCGIVYKLTPHTVGKSVVWSETVLYTFEGGADGSQPAAQLTIDGNGNLYGTALAGGLLAGTNVPPCGTYGAHDANNYGCGVVFMLTKGVSAPWAEHILYAFTGGADGAQPKAQVNVSAGNFYGTAFAGGNLNATKFPNCSADEKGGAPGCGVAFELTKPKISGTFPWRYVNLFTFTGGADGNGPMSPLLPEKGGALLGGTIAGGVLNNAGCNDGDPFTNAPGCGVLFELTPP